jgi:hypothetical protein
VIVTIVRFPARTTPEAETMSVEQARALFASNAHAYLDRPGLLWKAYLLADDGSGVGGTYWWADRPSAEAMFTDDWLAGVTEKYGAAPEVEWFEAPVVVDARFDTVRVQAPPPTGAR